jgi:hypothetical protein
VQISVCRELHIKSQYKWILLPTETDDDSKKQAFSRPIFRQYEKRAPTPTTRTAAIFRKKEALFLRKLTAVREKRHQRVRKLELSSLCAKIPIVVLGNLWWMITLDPQRFVPPGQARGNGHGFADQVGE